MVEFAIETIKDRADVIELRLGSLHKESAKEFLVFLNGRTEWIEKYHYLFDDLDLKEGTGFLTWDHRGQGDSGGRRAFVDTYDDYANDAEDIVNHIVKDRPYSIISHSMGGLIALFSVLKGKLKPQKMILSSPLLGLPNDPVPRILAKPVAKTLSRLNLGAFGSGAGIFTHKPFADNQLTHDEAKFMAMRDTPYPVGSATFKWVAASFEAIDFVFAEENVRTLKCPTLIVKAENETVVDGEACDNWVQLAKGFSGAPVVELQTIAKARHEIFSEEPPIYESARKTVKDFLES
jgi:lysophospholipase